MIPDPNPNPTPNPRTAQPPTSTTTATTVANERSVVVGHAEQALKDRGVTAVDELLNTVEPEVILDSCSWWDRQHNVSPGLLVQTIRNGGHRQRRYEATSNRGVLEQQQDYANRIAGWLNHHFPDLSRPGWGPHPAAVTAVIRLHWLHGKNTLTVREHGPAIRQAVKAWDNHLGENL